MAAELQAACAMHWQDLHRLVAQRASQLVTGRHRSSEAVQPVTERRNSRVRTASGLEHGDVTRPQVLSSSTDLQAAPQPGLDQANRL